MSPWALLTVIIFYTFWGVFKKIYLAHFKCLSGVLSNVPQWADIFLSVRLGLCGIRMKSKEVECRSQHNTQCTQWCAPYQHDLFLASLIVTTIGWPLQGFFTVKHFWFFFFPYCPLEQCSKSLSVALVNWWRFILRVLSGEHTHR